MCSVTKAYVICDRLCASRIPELGNQKSECEPETETESLCSTLYIIGMRGDSYRDKFGVTQGYPRQFLVARIVR